MECDRIAFQVLQRLPGADADTTFATGQLASWTEGCGQQGLSPELARLAERLWQNY